jgi:epoxyqueuosine reductase
MHREGKRVHEVIEAWAAKRGFAPAWGHPDVLEQVRCDIAERQRNREFDPVFYENALSKAFSYGPKGPVEEVKSVLLLAIPRPAHSLLFETEQGLLRAAVPPTYVSNESISNRCLQEIRALVGPDYHFEEMGAPKKSVAARAGLISYGRNNITYTPQFGSYLQLAGFLTDFDPSEHGGPPPSFQEPRVMDRCENCHICRNACPSGAIAEDRFLLHAEMCLTFLNEYHVPWPAWLPRGAHNCIVGCMKCQQCCPANKDLLTTVELPETFTVEETRAILAEGEAWIDGTVVRPPVPKTSRTGPVWDEIRAKLERVGLPGMDDVIGRNLRVLTPG